MPQPWTLEAGAFKDVEFLPVHDALIKVCETYPIRMFGKVYDSNRVCCMYTSDLEQKVYVKTPIMLWKDAPDGILHVKEGLESRGHKVDYVLCNLYRSGKDYIGWHADNEALRSPVMSVSLGEARRFQFRRKTETKGHEWEATLAHGDFLLMHGPRDDTPSCQKLYKHRVPPISGKKSDTIGPRINLTFREFE